jgi:RNA polymerase sigma-70 factor, ECF subfamily
LQTNLDNIIEACKREEPLAQEQLYKHVYPAMIKICNRYCRQADTAGSIFNQAMLKVFSRITQYAGSGPIEGWIRTIIVNTCIDHCRSKIKFTPKELTDADVDWLPVVPDTYNRISSQEILHLVHDLPGNTGLVFNLFVIEGYKHEEIGKIIGISAGTSKWHLNEARRLLKLKLDSIFKKEFLAHVI